MCMTLLVVWIWLSNWIIGKAVNKDTVRKVEFESAKMLYQKDYIYYVAVSPADYIRYDGGWLDKLSISGWAFCETSEDNQDRKISFLLKSNGACYELKPFITSRLDVPINVPMDLNRPDMQITPLSGYTGQFSLVNVERGIYDIYLCCWENETNHGMADTLYQLVRDEADASVIPWSTSGMEDSIVVTQDTQTLGYLDSASESDGKITVRGWEFATDEDSYGQNVYVEITDSAGNSIQYPTKSLTRSDVAKSYNDQKYAQSGYVTIFSNEDLKDGLSTVRILVENGGEVWQSKQYSLYKSGEQIRVFQSPIWIASALENPLTATEGIQSPGYLDSVKLSGGLVTFTGWEFAPDRESSESAIVVEITDSAGNRTRYSTMSLPWTGVAKDYNDQRYLQSGYTMSIADGDLPDGTYSVRVFTENGGAVWRSKQYTVARSGEEITVQQY